MSMTTRTTRLGGSEMPAARLIPATVPEEQVKWFGVEVPLDRPGQPAELAPVYVMLASDEASYVSGALIAAPAENRCGPSR
jgi:NAD(P)-dependent dehydrogenase (short-subunit alcohol dehydrogenase family)